MAVSGSYNHKEKKNTFTVLYTVTEKNLHINGPTQVKPVSFQGSIALTQDFLQNECLFKKTYKGTSLSHFPRGL